MKIQPKFNVPSVSATAIFVDTYNEESHYWWESILHPTNGFKVEVIVHLAEVPEPRIRSAKASGTGNKYSFDPKRKSWQKRSVSLPSITNKNSVRDARIRAQKREKREQYWTQYWANYDSTQNSIKERIVEVGRLVRKGRPVLVTFDERFADRLAAK